MPVHATRVEFNPCALGGLARGVDLVAAVVAPTLGPLARTVLSEVPGMTPRVESDGRAASRELELTERLPDLGARLAREAAYRIDETVGDGTATALVMLQALVAAGRRALAAGHAPVRLRRGMEAAARTALQRVASARRPCTGRADLVRLATLSADGDDELGRQIGETRAELGRDGLIGVVRGARDRCELEVRTGMWFDGGLASQRSLQAGESQLELKRPWVVVHEGPIESFAAIAKVLEGFATAGKALLFAADGFSDQALAALLVNRKRGGLQVAAVRPAGAGRSLQAAMDDIAAYSGATLLGPRTGLSLEGLRPFALGQVDRAVAEAERTRLVGVADAQRVADHCASLRLAIERETHLSYDREQLQRRLARFTSGIAELRVGGHSDAAVQLRIRLAERADKATAAALTGGVVPGGGAALLHAAGGIASDPGEHPGERAGRRMVAEALAAPARQIIANAGFDAVFLVAALRDAGGPGQGFDVRAGRAVDMIEAGIADPYPVVRAALETAISTAVQIVGTAAAVARR